MVIEDLKKHPDLLVKETDNLNITVVLLASLTAELKERFVKYKYAEIKDPSKFMKTKQKGE